MDTAPSDFPFGILDVAQLLHLNIRRRQAESVYADCPFCGDKRGKLNLNFSKNVWRCNYCGVHAGTRHNKFRCIPGDLRRLADGGNRLGLWKHQYGGGDFFQEVPRLRPAV